MVWFDLDNSPHVPLFRPVLRELLLQNEPYLVTARDFAQTRALLNLWNIGHLLIGTHGGKWKARKIANLVHRSIQLRTAVSKKAVRLAVSHGSRSQVVTAAWMRIPSLVMLDYEFTEHAIFNSLASHILVPSLIPQERLRAAGYDLRKIILYDGYKEELYIEDFVPDPDFRRTLGCDDRCILVTVRPPSLVSNYHERRSEELFRLCLKHFLKNPEVLCLVVGRLESDKSLVPSDLVGDPRIRFLTVPVDGLQLLWSSDIVISGGGTMSREAALLGVPVYSLFTGRRPFLDEHLQQIGRLQFLENASMIEDLPVQCRKRQLEFAGKKNHLARAIAELILDLSKRKS